MAPQRRKARVKTPDLPAPLNFSQPRFLLSIHWMGKLFLNVPATAISMLLACVSGQRKLFGHYYQSVANTGVFTILSLPISEYRYRHLVQDH